MTNVVQIKRSATTATPPALAVGELAYSEASNNLFIGTTGTTITKIGGYSDVLKLSGIEAGAQVNTVLSVNSMVGNVLVTAANIGLGNVTNESKATMFTSPTFTGTVSGVTAAMVGLGNVNNTSDANKPVSTAQQAALDLKANIASPTFTGTVSGITATMVGLGNVTNESKATMFTNPTFTGTVTVPTPTAATDAVTKQYVDNAASGVNVKAAVRAASTTNGTFATAFANGQTMGGVTLVTGDRILIKDQTTATENGIYDVQASGAPVRSADADNSPALGEVTSGMMTYVTAGTNAGTQWILTTPNPITLGTTALTFVQFGGSLVYTAGTGLTLTSTTFAIDSTVLTTSSTLDVTKLSTGTATAFNGTNITNLNASSISSGTINDARLSSAVLLNTSTIDCGTF
jgi:hypothetical protein